jgi:hypothetical protein
MTNTEVKGTAKGNLEYTGIVKLYQYTHGKKRTIANLINSGGKPLFDFLSDCLAGDFDSARFSRPDKVLLLNEDLESGTLECASTGGFTYIMSKPERVPSDSEGIVRYSFSIPQDQLYNAGRINFNAIGLYPYNVEDITELYNYAAKVAVTDLARESILPSSVLMLDWELHISNS